MSQRSITTEDKRPDGLRKENKRKPVPERPFKYQLDDDEPKPTAFNTKARGPTKSPRVIVFEEEV